MKRLVSLLLLIALTLSCVVGISAAEEPKLTLKLPAEMPKAGESFQAELVLSDNPGMFSLEFTLGFDKTKLTCTGIDLADFLSAGMTADNPDHAKGLSVAVASGELMQGSGTAATLTFTAQEDITAWDFTMPKCLYGGADNKTKALTYDIPSAQSAREQTSGSTSSGGSTSSAVSGETAPIIPTDSTVPTLASFTDVKTTDWHYEWVQKAVEKGLFKGNSDGSFAPDGAITRVQFVTVLWRMAGKPAATAEAPFTDMSNEIAEFRSAVAWAYEKGVVGGTSATTFAPRAVLTREAAMTILFRYDGSKVGSEMLFAKIYDDNFTDSAKISPWAKNAIYWGIYNEIISGTGATTLSPEGTATRAQIAKILVGYSSK